MSYWDNAQAALEQVFQRSTGIAFMWDEEPRKMMRRPCGILALGESITIGRDRSGYTFRDSDITLDLFGFRELTVNVQIFSRQAKGEDSARALIERARLSMANPFYRDELRSAGLIFVENHPVVDLDFSFDQRRESRAAFDVVFRLMLHEQQVMMSDEFIKYGDTRGEFIEH